MIPVRAHLAAGCLRALVSAVDLLPAGWRYGYVNPIARRLLGGDQPAGLRSGTTTPAAVTPTDGPRPAASLHAALVTGRLDVGGVEAVVAMLAERLPTDGVAVTVLCSALGRTASALRDRGVVVHVVDSPEKAAAALQKLAPDVVQLHNAPPYLVEVARASRLPLVPVVHNTEVYNTPQDWRRAADLLDHAPDAVAVSSAVAGYFRAHLPREQATRWTVIPNAAPVRSVRTTVDRARARAQLGELLEADLGADPVVVCLARYDAQKNLPGTVASFHTVAQRAAGRHLRLVVAGEVTDWLEYRRADAVRRTGAMRDRVHLIGNSDAAMLLAAADALLLNSFFEGWPVAGTEAVAAGLPLVIADVGGAVELVAAGHGIVVPNAAGRTADLGPRLLARARRAALQPNAPAVRDALLAVAGGDLHRVEPQPADRLAAEVAGMASAHAAVLGRAGGGPPPSVR
ncbi:MAG: glycosyltransferase family 4 protein [Cellulomonas sp.]|nr:glycosyltransferase family 4 protein [Cellulomonas sp.]